MGIYNAANNCKSAELFGDSARSVAGRRGRMHGFSSRGTHNAPSILPLEQSVHSQRLMQINALRQRLHWIDADWQSNTWNIYHGRKGHYHVAPKSIETPDHAARHSGRGNAAGSSARRRSGSDDGGIGPGGQPQGADQYLGDQPRGGQLYDKWWAVIEANEPEATHPAYPANAKKSGSTTWRCKECHGWDYKGVDGAYAKGSHRTGIKGLRDMADVDPETIHEILQDGTHGYTEAMMPHSAMRKIALFLSLGQIDMDRYIDRATKKAHGNPQSGAQFFQTICANCHGFDGREINFGDDKEPEFVGTVAAANPWEALHKIRFGQPGVGMVSLSVLDIQQQVDILSYAQTLPTK
jgi:thiosulfate dehydrogenase